MSALLAFGFAYVAKSQACGGDGSNSIEDTITSSAFGVKNTVYGKSSTAIGTSNTVSVKNSSKSAFAIGDANQATAKLTFALGDYNKVTKAYSFAIGSTNTVNANTSIAIGCWLKNTVDHGITIGFGSQKSLPLVNNTDGIMMGMNSDKPTFFISSSFCDGRTGRVGIGNVTEPQAKLHIKADNYSYDGEDADILLEPTRANKIAVIYFKDKNNSIAVSGSQMTFTAPKYSFTNAGITLGKNATTKNPEISFGGANKISVGTDSNAMNFSASSYSFTTGKVGIGCENTAEEFALAVKGGILTDDVLIRSQQQWPDYVFGKDYNLMSLPELKRYISENRHLPDMPSETEVAGDGVSVGEMQALLLRKVEELTLYTIQQQEMIERLREQCEHQQKMIDELIGK